MVVVVQRLGHLKHPFRGRGSRRSVGRFGTGMRIVLWCIFLLRSRCEDAASSHHLGHVCNNRPTDTRKGVHGLSDPGRVILNCVSKLRDRGKLVGRAVRYGAIRGGTGRSEPMLHMA